MQLFFYCTRANEVCHTGSGDYFTPTGSCQFSLSYRVQWLFGEEKKKSSGREKPTEVSESIVKFNSGLEACSLATVHGLFSLIGVQFIQYKEKGRKAVGKVTYTEGERE